MDYFLPHGLRRLQNNIEDKDDEKWLEKSGDGRAREEDRMK